MIQRLVPAMRERGWGRVIQIGGGLAQQPMPMQSDYNASLAAHHNLAVSLARELKGSGVTSNVVAPGAILIPAVQQLLTEIAPRYGWGKSWEEIERIQQRHSGVKVMAYTLINLRKFCGTSNVQPVTMSRERQYTDIVPACGQQARVMAAFLAAEHLAYLVVFQGVHSFLQDRAVLA
jgi:NAD(P)-dependent dehydrogenase (short-subunit alcohol dehydrogenase family)